MRSHPLLLAIAAAALGLGGCATGTAKSAPADTPASASPTTDAADDDYSIYDLPSTWRDQRDAELRLPALAGKVRVLAMVYTSCHASCPLIVADLKRIEASIPAVRRDDVGFVLVSLDPERDTPGRLATWASQTRLDPARWTLLNGDADAVREIAAALGVRYQSQRDAELAHTNVITVLDASGAILHQQVGLGAETRGTVAAVRQALR